MTSPDDGTLDELLYNSFHDNSEGGAESAGQSNSGSSGDDISTPSVMMLSLSHMKNLLNTRKTVTV